MLNLRRISVEGLPEISERVLKHLEEARDWVVGTIISEGELRPVAPSRFHEDRFYTKSNWRPIAEDLELSRDVGRIEEELSEELGDVKLLFMRDGVVFAVTYSRKSGSRGEVLLLLTPVCVVG